MSNEPLNLAVVAQEAAVLRLEDATIVTIYEESQDSEITDEQYQEAAAELSAPYCGCMTCVAREVIDAAWPYLSVYALLQYQDAMNDPETRAQIEKMAERVRAGEFPRG